MTGGEARALLDELALASGALMRQPGHGAPRRRVRVILDRYVAAVRGERLSRLADDAGAEAAARPGWRADIDR